MTNHHFNNRRKNKYKNNLIIQYNYEHYIEYK